MAPWGHRQKSKEIGEADYSEASHTHQPTNLGGLGERLSSKIHTKEKGGKIMKGDNRQISLQQDRKGGYSQLLA